MSLATFHIRKGGRKYMPWHLQAVSYAAEGCEILSCDICRLFQSPSITLARCIPLYSVTKPANAFG